MAGDEERSESTDPSSPHLADEARRGMSRLQSALIAAGFQYGAAGLGVFLGLVRSGQLDVPRWIIGLLLEARALATIALLALLVEMIRFMSSPRLRQAHRNTGILCEALLLYAAWFHNGLLGIFDEPSLYYGGNQDLVFKILLLVPFLLAIGPLLRSRAWIGVAGTLIFLVVVLEMLVGNAFARGWGSGFRGGWVA